MIDNLAIYQITIICFIDDIFIIILKYLIDYIFPI